MRFEKRGHSAMSPADTPQVGLPARTGIMIVCAVFTEACTVISKGAMSKIVASYAPFRKSSCLDYSAPAQHDNHAVRAIHELGMGGFGR
jgi:hypothetical protein